MSRKVAVIGCGHWGKNLVRNFHELDALGAVCDPDANLVSSMAQAYGTKPLSLDEICRDDEIEGLVVAAPAPLHCSISLAGLAAGKHVYVEKPLSVTVAESEEMLAAAKEAGRHVMVGHLLHYHAAFRKLRSYIQEGNLGAIRHIQSNRLSFGKLRAEEDVLWSFAPHDLSMVLGLLNCEPSQVSAEKFDMTGNGLSDKATLSLLFPNNVSAQINVSWLHSQKEQKLLVICEKGMVEFDDTKPWEEKLTVYPQFADINVSDTALEKAESYTLEVQESEPLKVECQHFLDVIEGKAECLTDGEAGLQVLRVLTAAH